MSNIPTLTGSVGADDAPDPEVAVVDLGDERVGDLFGALSSSTARAILQRLRDAPAPPADLAADVDTSVQNVHYHLDRLEAAGVVEVVDTVYSQKGREMEVFAPAADPLVIVAGDDESRETLVEELSRLLGAVGVLALASVLVQQLVRRLFYPGGPSVVGDGGQYAAPPTVNVAPPIGLYVFVAGLVLLGCWVGWWRRRTTPGRRPP